MTGPGKERPFHTVLLAIFICCSLSAVGNPSFQASTAAVKPPLLRIRGGGRLREEDYDRQDNERVAERLLARLGGSLNIDDMAEVLCMQMHYDGVLEGCSFVHRTNAPVPSFFHERERLHLFHS
jgi:hypothetical protein